MRFADIPYERPDLAAATAQFEELLVAFPEAGPEDQVELVRACKKLRSRFVTQQSLCHIRHTADTRDEFYASENAFFDGAGPQFEALVNRFSKAVTSSPHRTAIMEAFGPQFLRRTEIGLKAFDPGTVEALGRENQLASAYTKVKAQAEIEFRGETYNLSSIQPLMLSPDRDTRREASRAHWAFFERHEAELGRTLRRTRGAPATASPASHGPRQLRAPRLRPHGAHRLRRHATWRPSGRRGPRARRPG